MDITTDTHADTHTYMNMNNTALLVIDLQPIFTNNLQNDVKYEFEKNISTTLSYMRNMLPPECIVHLRANYSNTPMKTRSYHLNPNLPVPDDITPTTYGIEHENEVVFEKSTINGFHDTPLDKYLKSKNIIKIYCIGLLTAACVHETAIGGLNRGYIPILIQDACIDKTVERHQMVIDLYHDYLYEVISIEDLIKVD